MVTTVPLALVPRVMPPLLPVAVSDSAAPDARAVVVVMLLLFDTEKLVNVAPSDASMSAYPEFVAVTAPVVFTVKLGVDVAKPPSPISPDVEVIVIDVVPVKVP
jgi:hypothetical protein